MPGDITGRNPSLPFGAAVIRWAEADTSRTAEAHSGLGSTLHVCPHLHELFPFLHACSVSAVASVTPLCRVLIFPTEGRLHAAISASSSYQHLLISRRLCLRFSQLRLNGLDDTSAAPLPAAETNTFPCFHVWEDQTKKAVQQIWSCGWQSRSCSCFLLA